MHIISNEVGRNSFKPMLNGQKASSSIPNGQVVSINLVTLDSLYVYVIKLMAFLGSYYICSYKITVPRYASIRREHKRSRTGVRKNPPSKSGAYA